MATTFSVSQQTGLLPGLHRLPAQPCPAALDIAGDDPALHTSRIGANFSVLIGQGEANHIALQQRIAQGRAQFSKTGAPAKNLKGLINLKQEFARPPSTGHIDFPCSASLGRTAPQHMTFRPVAILPFRTDAQPDGCPVSLAVVSDAT